MCAEKQRTNLVYRIEPRTTTDEQTRNGKRPHQPRNLVWSAYAGWGVLLLVEVKVKHKFL